jgi:hypothetical protein
VRLEKDVGHAQEARSKKQSMPSFGTLAGGYRLMAWSYQKIGTPSFNERGGRLLMA